MERKESGLILSFVFDKNTSVGVCCDKGIFSRYDSFWNYNVKRENI